MLTELILTLSAFLTSILSTITGMGGGVALLGIMTYFYPLQTIIPIHGAAQLGANSSRCYFLRKSIRWDMTLPYVLGIPCGVFSSIYLLQNIFSPGLLKLLLAAFIFYAVFKPKKLPSLKIPPKLFFLIGIIGGALGILIGSVGPFLAPFLIRDDLSKEEIIASKSAMQMFTHFSKIPSFLYLSFSYWDYKEVILLLIIAVFLGSIVGVRILKRINKDLFLILFKGVLLLAATRLIINAME